MSPDEREALREARKADPLGQPEVVTFHKALPARLRSAHVGESLQGWARKVRAAHSAFVATERQTPEWYSTGSAYLHELGQGAHFLASVERVQPGVQPGGWRIRRGADLEGLRAPNRPRTTNIAAFHDLVRHLKGRSWSGDLGRTLTPVAVPWKQGEVFALAREWPELERSRQGANGHDDEGRRQAIAKDATRGWLSAGELRKRAAIGVDLGSLALNWKSKGQSLPSSGLPLGLAWTLDEAESVLRFVFTNTPGYFCSNRHPVDG